MSRPKGWKKDEFFVQDVSYSFDNDTEEALNVATPRGNRPRKRSRNSFSTSRLPCAKSMGPLAEAIKRQDNVPSGCQSRIQNNPTSTDEGTHVRHQPTSTRRKHSATLESCSTKSSLMRNFSSTFQGLKKKVMTYTDRAANAPKIGYGRGKLERSKDDADLVDLCDERSSSKDVKPTESLQSLKLHRRLAEELETNFPMKGQESFVSASPARGRDSRMNEPTKAQSYSSIAHSLVSDSVRRNICHSLNDEDDSSSGVLASISKERFTPKTQDRLSFLTGSLPAANAPTLTKKCTEVTKEQRQRNLSFTKANGTICKSDNIRIDWFCSLFTL
jgi:hypothetical protein